VDVTFVVNVDRRWSIGAIALLLFALPRTAQAQRFIAQDPDYVFSIWLRAGLTSKGIATAGLALDFLPFTAGVDIAPRNELGQFRVFFGVKAASPFPVFDCNLVLGISGAAVYAFGPGQPGQFGVQLGAHVEDRPISRGGDLSFPKREFGGSYRFSWFPTAGALHDVDAGVGLLWAPKGLCESD
jgi:hypothetical protein